MDQFKIKENYPKSFRELRSWFNSNFFEMYNDSSPAFQLGYLWMFFNYKKVNLSLNTETSQELKRANEIRIKQCFQELESRITIGYKTQNIKTYVDGTGYNNRDVQQKIKIG